MLKHTSHNQKRIKANKRKDMLRAWRIESVIWTCEKKKIETYLHERVPHGESSLEIKEKFF